MLGASCTMHRGEEESGSTRGAGTNATDDASASCGVDPEWSTSIQELMPPGSTVRYWGQAAFDAKAETLLVLADTGSGYSGRVVRRCNVARKSAECTSIPIANADTIAGAANGRVAVLTLDPVTLQQQLVTCTYDGRCGVRRDVLRDSGGTVDAVNDNVIVYSPWAQADGSAASQFTVCPMAGGGCGAPWFQGFDRFDITDDVVDAQTGNQYIALHATANFLECAGSQGSWCAGFAFAAPGPDVQGPGQLLFESDAISLIKREIHASADRLVLFRCLRNGRTCAEQELSLGEGSHQIDFYSAVIDTERNRLLVVTEDSFRNHRPTLYACAADGTACEEIDISAGTTGESGDNPRAFLDGAADRMLVVTNGAESRIALFDVNLCGGPSNNDGGSGADTGGAATEDAGTENEEGGRGKSW